MSFTVRMSSLPDVAERIIASTKMQTIIGHYLSHFHNMELDHINGQHNLKRSVVVLIIIPVLCYPFKNDDAY